MLSLTPPECFAVRKDTPASARPNDISDSNPIIITPMNMGQLIAVNDSGISRNKTPKASVMNIENVVMIILLKVRPIMYAK